MTRRSTQLGTSGLLWMALVLGVTAARAEAPAEPSEPAAAESAESTPAAAPVQAVSDPQRQADALLEQAKELFGRGEYRAALPLVERAYVLTEAPRFLFNLGALHHKLSECVPARDYFELYLQRDPSGDGQARALSALEELHARCPAREAAAVTPTALVVPVPAATDVAPALRATPAEAPQREPEPLERSGAPGSGALLLLGVGAAAGIGALASLAARGHAESEIDALGSKAAREGDLWDAHEARRQDLASNARLYRGLSLGLGVACAAFVGAGTTVWILEARDGAGPRALAAGVTYRGQF